MLKILVVGLGSIGQRHLRNIKRLYSDEYEIIAYRVRGLQRTFSDDMQIRNNVSIEKEYNIRVYSELSTALDEKPDVAFITNITSQHIPCALEIAEAGCDIFMEKPLSDNLNDIFKLRKIVKEKKIILYMGYQNRFHPCIKDAKRFLPDIGDLISVNNEFGERLSTMHTYEDYRGTYMAKKNMGGGPILNLQIHAIDYLQWILGRPKSVFSMAGNNSVLDIDVEDYASSIYKIETGDGRIVPVYTHTDFWQYPPVHATKFIGTKGRIEIDLNKALTIEYIEGALVKRIEHTEFERNDMFIEELKDFFYCVKARKNSQLDIDQGIIGLKMAMMAKKSAETGTIAEWEEF